MNQRRISYTSAQRDYDAREDPSLGDECDNPDDDGPSVDAAVLAEWYADTFTAGL